MAFLFKTSEIGQISEFYFISLHVMRIGKQGGILKIVNKTFL